MIKSNTLELESLLVVRLSAMGDVIHALPAITALREALPDIKLGWLIEERWAELLCTRHCARSGPRSLERPLVDRVHAVYTKVWRRSMLRFDTWQQIARCRSELREASYDAVIDLQGAIRSALLSKWAGATVSFGSAHPRENAARMFYSRKVKVNDRDHVVEQGLDLVRAIVPTLLGSGSVLLPVDSDAEAKVDSLLSGTRRFAILNPGAGWGAKRWPAQRYAEVARELAKDNLISLVNCGPGEEDLAASVEAASLGAARKISCSISELIALTRRANLFIGGDTGPMHLAAALKIPVVAIFGPTNPARNGPFDTPAIVLRSPASVTDHSRHRDPEQGLMEITVGEVVEAARKLSGSDPRKLTAPDQ